MYKHLFFDDRYLFERENVKRCYGTPGLVKDAVFTDTESSTCWSGPWVFRLDDGTYRMIYSGRDIATERMAVYSAKSCDGIHFEKENVSGNSNLIMLIKGEIANVYEDKTCKASERYKMLYTEINPATFTVDGFVYVSGDLINWTLSEHPWSKDGEPVTGVFYNHKKQCHTIIKRPVWGVRMVGYSETCDWKSFSPEVWCMQQDSLDSPLDEIYGMPAFAYENIFIGFPHIYNGFSNCMSAKYSSGFIRAQLAYSYNGTNWLRSLREPFISGVFPDNSADKEFCAPMVWPSSMLVNDDCIMIYACASRLEHGPGFHEKGANGYIFTYKLRKDGFIALESDDKQKESLVATRENAWHGGELHLNLKAKKATVAIFTSNRTEYTGMNAYGVCEMVEGYSHEDCIPFEGDLCDWVPQYKNGKTVDALSGKALAFEIKFTDGTIYSISGDMTPLFNIEGERFRKSGILPDYI